MVIFRLLVIVGILTVGIAGNGQNCQPGKDSLVLKDFFTAMKGNSWKVKWNLNDPIAKWHGVKVNKEGCVIGLELRDNNLAGSLVNLDLPFLEELVLAENEMLSRVPSFSHLKNLQHLDLSGNQFIGQLPALSDNEHLITLKLKKNNFSGSIPDYSHLVQLEVLELSDNELTGSLSGVEELSKLKELDLSKNKLTGSIDFTSQYKQIVRIDLHNNQLNGSIPEFSGLDELDYINLSGNHLMGDVPKIKDVPKLRLIDFSENRLDGRFHWPEQAPELREMILSNNEISDTIQAPEGLKNLEKLHLSGNRIGGSIPDFSLPELTELFMDDNLLTGDIPDFSGLPALKQFSLKGNLLKNVRFNSEFLDQIVLGNISDNQLTFKDFVDFSEYENLTIILMPQKNIPFFMDEMTVTKGNNFTIKLDSDENHSFTQFDWYKDGEKSRFNFKTDYVISNVIPADAGEYWVELTNSKMPGAVIRSDTFRLEVECPTVVQRRNIYLCPGESFEFGEETITWDTVFVDSVAAQTDRVCDSLYIYEIQRYMPDSVHTESVLCHDEIYYFGPDSIELTESGFYIDTFPNLGGCDSVVHLDLTILPKYEQEVVVGKCPGDSLVVGDTIYFSNSEWVDTFTSVYGCDSIVLNKVEFSDPIETYSLFTLCEGDSVKIGDEYFFSDTILVDTREATGGCDSIVTLEVRVNERYEELTEAFVCAPEVYEWQGMELFESGFYSDTLQSRAGCDSIINLELKVYPSYGFHDTVYICQGDSVLFNGNYVKEPGNYFSENQTDHGCDSIHSLHVKIQDYVEVIRYEQMCVGDTIQIGDNSYSVPGVYTDTIRAKSEEGCDTLMILELDGVELALSDSNIIGSSGSGENGRIEIEIAGGVGPYRYEWSSGDTASVLDSVGVGEYSLKVTDSLGCVGEWVFEVPLLTSVSPGMVERKWVVVRPNRVNVSSGATVMFDFSHPMKSGRVDIYNEMGQSVRFIPIERVEAGQSLPVRLIDLPAGVYVVHIRETNGRGYQVERLVVF